MEYEWRGQWTLEKSLRTCQILKGKLDIEQQDEFVNKCESASRTRHCRLDRESRSRQIKLRRKFFHTFAQKRNARGSGFNQHDREQNEIVVFAIYSNVLSFLVYRDEQWFLTDNSVITKQIKQNKN